MIKVKEEKDKWYKGYFEDFEDKLGAAILLMIVFVLLGGLLLVVLEAIGLKALLILFITLISFYTFAHLSSK